MKDKSVIHITRNYKRMRQNFTDQNFWVRRFYVSTVGKDEAMIREYIRERLEEAKRFDQLTIFKKEHIAGLSGSHNQAPPSSAEGI